MFYSAQTGGFYDRSIHGDNIPGDAVEITREQHADLMDAHSQGKLIAANDNGAPIAIDPPPPSAEAIAAAARAKRDRLLNETDWVVIKAAEAGEQVPDQWRAYRQALRDVTAQAGFPTNIEWPEKP